MPESYTQTYTTFGGADIIATFNGNVIGELQGITYSVTREKAPIYTMGSADPRSFSRGKRGIAGSLIFTVFDRDALMETLRPEISNFGYTAPQNVNEEDGTFRITPVGVEEWGRLTTSVNDYGQVEFKRLVPKYIDQLPPFNITITFANEYGQLAVMRIYGVELLNEGSGMSIDDVVTERACTFVARGIDHIHRPEAGAGQQTARGEKTGKVFKTV